MAALRCESEDGSSRTVRPLGLLQLAGCFAILSAGLLVSAAALAFEIVLKNFNCIGFVLAVFPPVNS